MKNFLRSFAALPFDRALRHPDILLAAGVVCLIGVLILPVPPGVLDVLLAANVTFSALILVAILLADRALSVSSFPTILLLTTLFRLTLNVSTTRLILSRGDAGEVVQSFGDFVLSGDLFVGLTMFLIITFVQFLVIGKGAERVAEVGARFTLDAMPGKQMSIEAALRAGAINEEDAQLKRDDLETESKFYGAMDGAMKFVKGDSVAGLVITAINLVAGMLVGIVRFDMTPAVAAQRFAVLTVGDGLLSQIPALLITLAAGVMTTRVAGKRNKSNIAANLQAELFTNPKVLGVVGVFALVLAFIPGMPTLPFTILGAANCFASYAAFKRAESMAAGNRQSSLARQESLKQRLEGKMREANAQRAIADNLAPAVAPIELELDAHLSFSLGFVSAPEHATELVGQLFPALRDAIYAERGVRVPNIRVRRDVPSLAEGEFVIRLKEIPVLTLQIPPQRWFASESPERLQRFGIVAEPAPHFMGGVGAWVASTAVDELEAAGVRTSSPSFYIARFIAKVLREELEMFVGLQETADILRRFEKVYPELVKEVVPKIVSLSQLADILRRLVNEGISIKDTKSILEAVAEHGPYQTDNVMLTESVRAALSTQLGYQYAGRSGRLPVILLDDLVEDTVRGAIMQTTGGSYLALEPEIRRALLVATTRVLRPVLSQGVMPAILTSAEIRRYFRKLIEEETPNVAVLSFQELPAHLNIQPLGRVHLRDELVAA